MFQKQTKALISIVTLFLGGVLFVYVGFFRGRDIAISVSRPEGANGWTTSQELISSCIYFPIIIGVSLILLSIIFSSVLFIHWINKSN
ncbi:MULTISPECIES: hypothetical protein [Dehalobacter]|jgi:hypothetical protein|uniref:Uncharacterized protein n=2 Tax=Dehalobacter restrictus TaxID=55583 RepID=A0A857DHF3_9FIRM|nr:MULTISPECIES: hypothetical protein [Dehalobacter]AHF11367.1 hypothetical protein DEHRE_08860 [Dehalobacter restrictus DSM 9455]MCG1025067.1 hypothetical protein [Dehalobacter sp.]MDJ0305762.1 hypothetical protein [Dehalobacter sp.]OCZ52632.1 hypothetical protein A7D23_09870 [Dehalobacter sp. TeCB1]QHA00770.1 hypothetical protein GQ588_09055 [Dehalobacter restrictus]